MSRGPYYMRPAEAAPLLGMAPHGVRKALREGRLPGRKFGGRWRVLVSGMRSRRGGEELARLRLFTGGAVALWHDHGRYFTEQLLPHGQAIVVDVDAAAARECYAAGHQLRPFPQPVPAAPTDGKRRCVVCGAILSRFNEGDRCACHS